jgi:3-hydroxyacyl-CoA dehydrogenase/enoyl-CoA hydratase/3-hydroxybutyryl-CoA epimerase
MTVWDVVAPRNLELGPLASAPAGVWKHWKLARDADGIAWLGLDRADASANTLSGEVILELNNVLDTIHRELPKALVLRSMKRSGFIAGADINQFKGSAGTEVAANLAQAHTVVDRLQQLKIPTIAVIHGFCLGGGLEVALACKYRIATEDARLGFPEVLLGLHPGLGGTVRMTRLVRPDIAMEAMLTGRTFRARRARSIGLVDAVTQERHVAGAVKAAANGVLKTNRPGMIVPLLNSAPARSFLAGKMRSATEKKAPRRHYPAPHELIDLWGRHGGSFKRMQQAEIASFGHLITTPTAQNLVRVFFLREKLKSLAGRDWPGQRVHVIGAGAMGGDIAAWCAWNGLTVTLADMKSEPLGAAIKRAADLFRKVGQKSTEQRDALDRLIPDMKGDGVASADLIIEAVPEVLDLKKKIYAITEARMRPDAVLATNTSSIPLEQLREGLQRPERFIGIHFFNPVSRLELVEVVHHDKVAPEVVAAANGFLGKINRLPAPVKSAPGFLVNRALVPYMMEALIMVDQGIAKETIDRAAVDFGMPMGPIELADQVGLDICVHVADVLRTQLQRPMPETPQWLRDKVAKGELGRKTGNGMYVWKDDKAVKKDDAPAPGPDVTDRLILPMLDVCVTCLREGVVTDEEIIDGSMIFATGFAPFRGGPMHYARQRGLADVQVTLDRLAKTYGERFLPDPGWDNLT